MKTAIVIAAAVAALLAGCNSGKVGTTDGSANSGNSQTPSGSGPTFSLRILGSDLGDFRRASLDVATVQVKGPSGVLADKVMTTEVDLAQPDQAWLLSSFQVPEGVEDVDFTVSFTSGKVENGQGAFDVDAGCSTLRLSGKVLSIAQRRHAVIQLDVARSMVPSAAGIVLVPHYQLVY